MKVHWILLYYIHSLEVVRLASSQRYVHLGRTSSTRLTGCQDSILVTWSCSGGFSSTYNEMNEVAFR